jgi:DNA-binding CsgD family transcriptional regulator
MPISRLDETDLLIPLYEGMYEEVPWDRFLWRLIRRAGADRAGLVINQNGASIEDAAVHIVERRAEKIDRIPQVADFLAFSAMRPNRVYSGEELSEMYTLPLPVVEREDGAPPWFSRQVRVNGAEDLSGWLMVGRGAADFSAATSALLGGLAQHLAVIARTYQMFVQQRLRGSIADKALARLGVGWISFDSEARVMDLDERARMRLHAAIGPAGLKGQRLHPPIAKAGRDLIRECAAFAVDEKRLERIIRLAENPSLELLIQPADSRGDDMAMKVAAFGFVRESVVLPPGMADLVETLLNVSPSEARLATMLSMGNSLTEAAANLGLTIETVRNYSKRLYARTGTRGQSDLVRLVLTGLAVLACPSGED